jgi:hypothetical protein
MRYLTLIIALSVLGCGQEHLGISHNPVFDEYRHLFTQITGRDAKTPIQFGDTGDATASCNGWTTGNVKHYKHILVNEAVFKMLKRPAKLAVIFHEIIHCDLEIEQHEPDRPGFHLMEATLSDVPTEEEVFKQLEAYR